MFVFITCILSCLVLAALSSPAGKGLTSWLSCVCDVFLCFCHFPIWCLGSGMVLDCIDSWSLASFFYCNSNLLDYVHWHRRTLSPFQKEAATWMNKTFLSSRPNYAQWMARCHLYLLNIDEAQTALRAMMNSKRVWLGNTTITNCRRTHSIARKSHTKITRHQEDKQSKPTSSLTYHAITCCTAYCACNCVTWYRCI